VIVIIELFALSFTVETL